MILVPCPNKPDNKNDGEGCIKNCNLCDGSNLIEDDELDLGGTNDVPALSQSNILNVIASWQFHAAVDTYGLKQKLASAIDQIYEPDKTSAHAMMLHAPTYNKQDPIMVQIAENMKLENGKFDEIWVYAQGL